MIKGAYTVLDIETTGLSRYYHKITEIAAIKIDGAYVTGRFETLVNPQRPIPHFITNLTGISDEMVRDAPPIEEALPKFIKFLDRDVIVAHNAWFDRGFIQENAQRLGQQLDNSSICTCRLARRLLPDAGSKSLGNLCARLNIQNEASHRAMGDAGATAKMFLMFKDILEKAGIKGHDDIIRFQSITKAKALQALNATIARSQ